MPGPDEYDTDLPPHDFSTVTTSELVAELKNRFDALHIVGATRATGAFIARSRWMKGDPYVVVGLLDVSLGVLRAHMVRQENPPISDGHEGD